METKGWKKLRWYLVLFYEFVRISFRNQIEYRLNFAAGFFVEVAYMLIKLTYLIVVLNAGVNIGPLTPEMVGIFVGTYMFMTGIWMLFSGVNAIPYKVLNGNLDLVITKPGSLQFMQTMGRFDFAMALPNTVAGLGIVVWSWNASGIPATPASIAGFVFFLFLGIILTYGFTLIPCLLIFWVTAVNGVNTFFSALWDFNNMPMVLYTQTIKLIGTFLVPVFIITNWAGLFVLDMLSPLELAWGIAVPFIVFILARVMFVRGMRRYTSANG